MLDSKARWHRVLPCIQLDCDNLVIESYRTRLTNPRQGDFLPASDDYFMSNPRVGRPRFPVLEMLKEALTKLFAKGVSNIEL